MVCSLHVCSLFNLGNMFFITVSYKLKKQESFSKSPGHVEGLGMHQCNWWTISSTTWVMIAHTSTYALALNSSEMSRIWISSIMEIFILTVQISPKDDANIFYCLFNITHSLNISMPWPPGDSIKLIDSTFLHLSAFILSEREEDVL